jgi:DNA-directed RNA polymerase subunit L
LVARFFAQKIHKVDICFFNRRVFKMADTVVFSNYSESGPKLLKGEGLIQGTFQAAPMHVTIANTIRRQVLAAVKTVGFKTEPPELSDVNISVNTTPLVNEMLMHRIGMIPVFVEDPDTFNSEIYEFRINVENVGNDVVPITSADIQVFKSTGDDGQWSELSNKDFFPLDPITGMGSLITILRPRYNIDSIPERLTVRAKASVGTGRQNMRFSSVAQCSYEYTLDPNPSRQEIILNNWLAVSKKVANPAELAPERLAELKREFECLEVQRCYLIDEKGEPYDFTFHIESVGVLSVPTIIERAIKSCEDIVSPYLTFDTDFPQDASGQPTVVCNVSARRMENSFEFIFQNEEHTLGNLLQTYLVERHVDGKELPRIRYAGYKVPHPLRSEMVLVVAPEDGQENTARLAVANTCKFLKQYFNNILQSWKSVPKESSSVRAGPSVQEPATTAKVNKKRANSKKP